MKICIVGLGLIGGSAAMALKRAGYEVYGMNRSQEALTYSLENGIIDYAVEDFYSEDAVSGFDVVLIALPVNAAIDFLCSRKFKNGAVAADFCGVKRRIERAVFAAPRNYLYVGAHPMAGKEVSTVKNACADLYDNASIILTVSPKTSLTAISVLEDLAKDMGFKCIAECSAKVHDAKISYTSQLAHIVSNAYVRDGEIENCLPFTGGSFQDMTRIAGVDEAVWSELYLANKRNLSNRIQTLINNLTLANEALQSGDKDVLEQFLHEGVERFNSSEKQPEEYITEDELTEDDIKVISLK
ncbi:MAG: prephenate dehydrogenase [Clostridia bacterium]|nr:prephenate dehydrogenase [Clostridia bacterium]